MTSAAANMIEHPEWCDPQGRPGGDGRRIESFTTARYGPDDITVTSVALTTRCLECGEQTVQG